MILYPELSPITQNENGACIINERKLVNTQYFTEAARHFVKHGCYTFAPQGSRDFNDFWDREEKRRKEGYKVGDVYITGEHYGYLNYAQIKLTKDPRKQLREEAISKNLKISAEKKFTFPDFWDGDYYYFHAKDLAREQGKHMGVGKARRKGYSYKNGWISANRADLYPDSITVIGAYDSAYLFPEGTMGMADNYLQFLSKHTDWAKGRLIDREDHIKIGYVLVDSPSIERGFKSQIIAVSFGPNRPGAARGKDGTLIMLEEAGKFNNLLAAYTSTRPTVEDGIYVTGQIIVFGTGGDEDTNWEDFERIFYNPRTYNILPFENVWDEKAHGTSCCFFVPQVLNKPGFIDQYGNSLKSAALKSEEAERQRIKEESISSSDLDTYIAEYPNSPSEAFSRNSDNIFPSTELNDQLFLCEHDPNIKYLHRSGLMVSSKTGCKFKSFEELGIPDRSPIFNFPHKKEDDVRGCVVMWQPPYRDKNGNVPKGLYRIWNDPYAEDKDTDKVTLKNSLGATYIYEVPNNFTPSRGDIIVGAYVGRPSLMDTYNEQLLLLTLYYNATCQFENDRGDVKNYFRKNKAYHLLADEPDVIWKKELQATKTGRNKGITMNDNKRKPAAAIYLRDWLMTVRSIDNEGNKKLNLHYIYDPGLLRELLKWNKKGNFDRTSSLLVGMFDMKEIEQIGKPPKETKAKSNQDLFGKKLFQN